MQNETKKHISDFISELPLLSYTDAIGIIGGCEIWADTNNATADEIFAELRKMVAQTVNENMDETTRIMAKHGMGDDPWVDWCGVGW